MDTKEEKSALGHRYFIEEIFEDFDEYKKYLSQALALFKEQDKRRKPSFQKLVPEYLEIRFNKSIKSPRLYFPRYEGLIIVEIPDNKTPPKRKAVIRERALKQYVGIIKINEFACADEIASRMKIMENKHRRIAIKEKQL